MVGGIEPGQSMMAGRRLNPYAKSAVRVNGKLRIYFVAIVTFFKKLFHEIYPPL